MIPSQSDDKIPQLQSNSPINNTTMSFIKSKLPPLHLPEVKRSKIKTQSEKNLTNTELMKPDPKSLNQGLRQFAFSLANKKKKAAWIKQTGLLDFISAEVEYEQLKSNEMIINVLKYVFNEFKEENQSFVEPFKALYQWEVLQIQQNIRDTNLGDFIIKFPNPDNLPDEIVEKYEELEESDGNVDISIYQADQFYEDLFNVETSVSKNNDKNQKLAFMIAFFLLNLQYRNRPTVLEKVKPQVDKFQNIFNYFLAVKDIEVENYLKLKKTPQFVIKECLLPEQILIQISEHCDAMFEAENKDDSQKIFQTLLEKLYNHMKKILYDRQQRRNDPFVTQLFLTTESITKIFHYFPKLLHVILNYAKKMEQKETRKLCKGEYLKKVIQNNNLRWVIGKKIPTDVMTLLRKFLLFRFTQRGGLFLRSFLSKDETSIFFVLKTRESILQKNAQSNKTQMEIQLGSTDLFSFEPVDSYLRPLRVHNYIRNIDFIKKYNLSTQKEDKDFVEGERSIESEAMNFYKKAEKMNTDELRAKIILDQEQADECYKWVSNKLGIGYITSKEVLLNEYNVEQIEPDIWQIYYVYNKFIIQYINRVRFLYKANAKHPRVLTEINKNVGMLLRLMFLKAQYECNNLYYNHRQIKGLLPRACSNLFGSKEMVLKNIWNHKGIEVPKGFWTYIYTQKFDRIWRKYEINEMKHRSKFFPSTRLIITNSIIKQNLNVTKATAEKHILDLYPIHDPYILKNIKVHPYVNVIRSLLEMKEKKKKNQEEQQHMLDDLYRQYQCPYSQHDFTKNSIEDKLGFRFGKLSSFSIDTVRYYCGQKIAIFFEFRRFLSQKIFPFIFIAFLFQILFWAQIVDIIESGSSILKEVNDVFSFIMALINMYWVNRTIRDWHKREKQLALRFGVNKMTEEQNKRVAFEGRFMKKFQEDEMNFQYKPIYSVLLRRGFTFLITLAYIVLMCLVNVAIFVFKTYLYQIGEPQEIVSVVPSLLISISVQIFNYFYILLIKVVTNFEDHKTVESYESSLVFKSFLINFIVTFLSLFIYGFFSTYLDSQYLCLLRTNNGSTVTSCYYYVTTQLTTLVLVDLVTTIIAAFVPYIMFKIRQYFMKKQISQDVTFSNNYFESIDEFYEEQDKMQTYMYNEQIDNTWIGYIKLVIIFTALALFGPALPFIYLMLYLTGVIGLHSGKYEIIYLTKRSLPMKANSINIWLYILDFISVVGIIVSFAFVIFVRDVFGNSNSIVFFFMVLFSLIVKYLLNNFDDEKGNQMEKRNKMKTSQILHERGLLSSYNEPESVITDIENVMYDENELHRRFPKFRQANVRAKKKLD